MMSVRKISEKSDSMRAWSAYICGIWTHRPAVVERIPSSFPRASCCANALLALLDIRTMVRSGREV
jgi:hypothetical protein